MYDQKSQVEAWRRFIATGEIDESVVRPEIARSWKRCRAAGVNPWSSDFPSMDEKLLAVQRSMENSINNMTTGNEKKLELIRETVDEKLSGTLNKRFSESFSVINDQLKNVSKGLGEMTALATNVGDLKRVLTNVKTRGTWGEMQLGALLEQVLSPAQFVHNAHVRPRSQEVVYAIVLPGKQDGESVFLPIDSKFPMESYQRYCQASEAGNEGDVRSQRAALIAEIRTNARTIQNKYIVPPHTTDFAIMYLPTEGLYAIASGDAELLSQLQREYRVTVMGPATLGAFLNSLHMGFRTLAIQKHTSRLWKDVQKTSKEFEKFGGLLEKTQKKISEAGETLSAPAPYGIALKTPSAIPPRASLTRSGSPR